MASRKICQTHTDTELKIKHEKCTVMKCDGGHAQIINYLLRYKFLKIRLRG